MRKVLIVDDQPEVLRLYARGLEIAGYEVHTAETVDAGMLVLDSEKPDAALIDLKMPYVNGMGMLYRLRKAHPTLPVAIITGMQNLDKETMQEMGMLDAKVHFKPLSIPQLQQIVNDLTTKSSR